MLRPECEWRAYGTGDDIVFAVARERRSGRQSRATYPDRLSSPPNASLEVYFLDGQAAVYSAGVWEYDGAHGWWLDAIVERSYDEEHGWWLGAVMGAEAFPKPTVSRPRCQVALLRAAQESPNRAASEGRYRALPAPRPLQAASSRRAPRRR
jgi:hypothetical protein